MGIQRNTKKPEKSPYPLSSPRVGEGKERGYSVLKAAFLICLSIASSVSCAVSPTRSDSGGRLEPFSKPAALPVNQVVTPAGIQVELPRLRPQVLALSPDGRILVTSGKTHEIIVIDPASGDIKQRVPLPAEPRAEESPDPVSENILIPDEKGQASYTGLAFSPDGRRLYLSNVNGSIKVFAAAGDGTVSPVNSIPLPPADAPRRKEEIPAGIAVSRDGSRLYVALNLSNKLGELDSATGSLIRTFDVGVAPYDVVLVGRKAYVSNWGGRRPQPDDITGPAGRGTFVKVDPVRHIANEGSVTVIDLESGIVRGEILTHLHSSGLAVSPDRRYVACANAASDNISVIDTRIDRVVQTIWAKPSPADLFGASPNALAFDGTGKYLYAANGTQNAVAVIRFKPRSRASKLLGLIPAGWFPGAIVYHPRLERICVANIKGVETVPDQDKLSGGMGFNTHQYHGSLSLIPVPKKKELPRMSAKVWENYHRSRIAAAFLPPRKGQPARPVPERIGEPSVFKHAIYIIKENRTYDQVLGDMERGNGEPSLCIFGERVTPNQHKITSEFVLLDNTFCCSILSADGHQWSTTAFGTDYIEKSFAGWPRSYPDGMGEDEVDALAYAPTGFIWDNALRHGKTLRDYGEFAMPRVRYSDPGLKEEPDWTSCWREYNDPRGEVIFESEPAVESLRPYLVTNTVGWSMEVPDAFRADYFIKELKEFEKEGRFPELVLICLPDDHTSGTKEGFPTPEASVADNDVAFGRIVEAVSRSSFWKDTVIFGIEDDPQNGWDHVSGYRTTAYIVSPYTKRGRVVSTFYNTVSILRTIEQILGLPPMNQFDAAATPMYDCFADTPDFTPYAAVPNRVPLDQMNPPKEKIADPLLRKHAVISGRLNFKRIDACPEDVLNRILWHAVKGSGTSYPEWAVTPLEDDDD
jgi:DNA-binding beta-propeller fold protein YncE